jgi:hypothetical protein
MAQEHEPKAIQTHVTDNSTKTFYPHCGQTCKLTAFCQSNNSLCNNRTHRLIVLTVMGALWFIYYGNLKWNDFANVLLYFTLLSSTFYGESSVWLCIVKQHCFIHAEYVLLCILLYNWWHTSMPLFSNLNIYCRTFATNNLPCDIMSLHGSLKTAIRVQKVDYQLQCYFISFILNCKAFHRNISTLHTKQLLTHTMAHTTHTGYLPHSPCPHS